MAFFGRQPAAHPQAAQPADPPQAAAQPARRAKAPSPFERLFDALPLLFALATGAFLWYAGGFFTLLALSGVGIPVATLGLWAWCIPIGVTAVELRWWPDARLPGWAIWVFVIIGGLDFLSSVYGVYLWCAGRMLPLGPGVTIPTSGTWPLVVAVVAALVLTFAPERLMLWTLRMLYSLTR